MLYSWIGDKDYFLYAFCVAKVNIFYLKKAVKIEIGAILAILAHICCPYPIFLTNIVCFLVNRHVFHLFVGHRLLYLSNTYFYVAVVWFQIALISTKIGVKQS